MEKLKILSIDDAPLMLHAVSEILKDYYDIIIATSGEKGIESAKKSKPDLILLDIVMPKMSGFETLEFLKTLPETKNIPVVLVSGTESDSERIKGREQGAAGFVKKPFASEELMKEIAKHIGGK